MRKQVIAGNWKMNKTLQEGKELAKQINELVKNKANDNLEIVLAPPFIHLTELSAIVDQNLIKLSAQNCSMHYDGAHTGEISAKMLASTNTEYVIVGHSERRDYHHEDNERVLNKIRRCLENGLKPILCIGEKAEERKSGNYFNIVEEQIQESAFELSMEEFKNVTVAYEPVWAIGTGENASPEQAQEIHEYIRNKIFDRYGEEIAMNTTILYGGSVKPSNANELFAKPDVDGGLIGGASLKAEDFVAIIDAVKL
jgi:triosephosphate isomerase (TIM)